MSRKLEEELEKLIKRFVQDEFDSRVDLEGELSKRRSKDKNERAANRIKQELTRKGYFLEIQVYEKLKKKLWLTELNANYWNVEIDSTCRPWEELHRDYQKYNLDKETRTIDIISLKYITAREWLGNFSGLETKLVIECKYSGRENWAFFLETDFDLIQRYNADITGPVGLWGTTSYLDSLKLEQSCSGVDSVRHLIGCDTRDDAIENLQIIGRINWTSHLSPRFLTTAATTGVTLFGNEDRLYNATQQVLDAAVHQKARYEISMFNDLAKRRTMQEYWRIYPVIVFGGPLWAYTLESEGFVVKPIDWVTLYVKRKDHEYAVDIVSIDSFDSYLDIISEELQTLEIGGLDSYSKDES